MTCRELTEVLDEYLDGSMAAGARRVFEAHLAICEDCRHYLDSYQLAIRLGRLAGRAVTAEAAAVPAGLVRAALAARAAEDRPPHTSRQTGESTRG